MPPRDSTRPPAPEAAPAAAPAARAGPDTRAADARDRRLVRRLQAGDEAAFQELVRRYQDPIFGMMVRMIGNRHEAEDLAQEVFLTVYRAIRQYRGDGRFATWLYRIAANTCRNRMKYLRGRAYHRRRPMDTTPEAEDPTRCPSLQSHVPGPDAATEGFRLEDAIARAIADLDEDHRLLIVLRDIQGLSYQEILRVTGLPEGTLKSRLHRARVALRERLRPYLSEDT